MRPLILALALSTAGCGPVFRGVVQPDEGACRSGGVRFYVPENEAQRAVLQAWCEATGPAVFVPIRSADAEIAAITGTTADTGAADPVALATADSVLVVSWNAHVGGGSLEALVDDIRAGRLTAGDSVQHFVMLLQEVYRSGDVVPELRPGMRFPEAIEEAPLTGEPMDIMAWIQSHPELALIYAPSMRNGPQSGEGGREDRGSAIVSSVPMRNPSAYELPLQRQRRVVPVASVAGRLSNGESWQLQIASVHLENRPEGVKNPERARDEQIDWLLRAMPDTGRAVLGGDMNTWVRGPDEIAVWRVRDAYPDTPPIPPGPTYERAGVVRMYLDYLFFRVDEGAVTGYRRIPSTYGSDHYPLIAWVHIR